MDRIQEAAGAVEGLLGHGDAPARVTVPMTAWAVAVVGDALAVTTGQTAFDAASRFAIGAGLLSSVGAAVTGLRAGKGGASAAGVAGHAAGALAVGGLFAASLVLRKGAYVRGERPSALARGLALAGGGLAVAEAILARRLAGEGHAHGRVRLDPDAPLGLHRGRA